MLLKVQVYVINSQPYLVNSQHHLVTLNFTTFERLSSRKLTTLFP